MVEARPLPWETGAGPSVPPPEFHGRSPGHPTPERMSGMPGPGVTVLCSLSKHGSAPVTTAADRDPDLRALPASQIQYLQRGDLDGVVGQYHPDALATSSGVTGTNMRMCASLSPIRSGPGTVTNAPPRAPLRIWMSPSAWRMRKASRTVTRLVPRRSLSSRSGGRRSPGFRRPWRIAYWICSTIACEIRPEGTGVKMSCGYRPPAARAARYDQISTSPLPSSVGSGRTACPAARPPLRRPSARIHSTSWTAAAA